MIRNLDVLPFLQQSWQEQMLLLDVRAPAEFLRGHIPGAYNLPLFNDEERKTVGILYKQRGRDEAVLKGLELVGPKMAELVRRCRSLSPDKKIMVHCWRGGMRSESMAWLFRQAGYTVSLLKGGYKAYRQYVLHDLARPFRMIVIGGKTGSGKTAILQALASLGEQVVDLEGLAHHKGSVFGAIGEAPQPSVQQFENELHHQLQHLNPDRLLWVEDESHAIGKVFIPAAFWNQMRQAPILVLDVPDQLRVARLVADYAHCDDGELAEALEKIHPRMGGKQYTLAQHALAEGDYAQTARLTLRYYDKAYAHGLKQRASDQVHHIQLKEKTPALHAQQLLAYARSHLYGKA